MSKVISKQPSWTETDVGPDTLARLRAAAALPEETIDLTDPDSPKASGDWAKSVRGKYYRPPTRIETLPLDADVLDWFKASGPNYKSRINRTLRAAMLDELRHKRA